VSEDRETAMEVLLPLRRGPGRPPGAKNKITWYRQLKVAETREEVVGLLERAGVENIFNGDALAGLQSIYMNGDLPLYVRMEAMIAAAPYEKPKLASINLGSQNNKAPLRIVFAPGDEDI
jgi:hypothetical protein